jgi:hypothetical protein
LTIDGKTLESKDSSARRHAMTNDGLCVKPNVRTVYIHPAAIADCGSRNWSAHELMHARFYDY